MSFNTLFAGHRNDASQRDDHILRCVVNGCDTLEYGSLICKAHSNPAHRNILNTVSQLQHNIHQPGHDPADFLEAQGFRTSEINLQKSMGSPHMDTPPLPGTPQSSFSVHNRQQTGYFPSVHWITAPSGQLIWVNDTNSIAPPSKNEHYREQHTPVTGAQHHGDPNRNPPHQSQPGYSVHPSPKLPPMRTLPPQNGTPSGQQFESMYGDIPPRPVLPGTLTTAAAVTTNTMNNNQTPVNYDAGPPNAPYRYVIGAQMQKHQQPHSKGQAIIKNSPSRQPAPLAQAPIAPAPVMLPKHSLPKRDVIVVDLTNEPSPPPGTLLRFHAQPITTEQPRKHDSSLAAPVPGPLQTPPKRKRKINSGEPIKGAPIVQLHANPGTTHPSVTQMEKQNESFPRTAQNQAAAIDPPPIFQAQIQLDPEPDPSRLDTDSRPAEKAVLPIAKPLNGNLEVNHRSRAKNKTPEFDAVAFDALIYQQEGAASPPEGVSVPLVRTTSRAPLSREVQLYLPTNPLIHRPYARSKEWMEHKNKEIQSRPRRKRWFGKAAERQRWLWANNDAVESDEGRDREDPQPWTYGRPLDYGDVSADDLPSDVLQNPAWVKACAWHRNTRQMEYLRRRERQRAAEQTRQFLRSVLSTSSIR